MSNRVKLVRLARKVLGGLLRSQRGISVIISALLMVTIVVIGSTIVYAWSLGVFGRTLPSPAPPQEILTMDLYKVEHADEVELLLRNTGSNAITLDRYYLLLDGRLIAQGSLNRRVVPVQATQEIEIETNFSLGFAHVIRIVTTVGNHFDFQIIFPSNPPP